MQWKTDDAGRRDSCSHTNQIGLEANVPKMINMRMNSRSMAAIQMYGTLIEKVEEFPYLGSEITSDESCCTEILVI